MRFLIVLPLLLGLFDLCLSEGIQESHPRVHTPLGIIEGFYNTTFRGQRYAAFQGIPYAAPPIGKSRFEIARSSSPWDGVLMAKEFSASCVQFDLVPAGPTYRISGSEDCLYLNIYTPVDGDGNNTWPSLLPVIFFIHGGSYMIGSASLYGPRYLMDRNVTLVTVNYRLGPLGFLSTEDDTVSGNMGLKDQVTALNWVKDNIKFFGGDPSRITLFGQSAGGSMVQYHYLSNLTTGLFHGGMSLSGTVFNPWSFIINPLEKAKLLATAMGCSIVDIPSMVHCLRYRPVHQMVNAVRIFTEWLFYPTFNWGPVVEKGAGQSAFMDRYPVDIIASGNVQDLPWMTGVVSEESGYPEGYFLAHEELFEVLDARWEALAPYILTYMETIPKSDQPAVGKLIRQHYLGGSAIDRATFNETARMIGDRIFVYHFEEAARAMARANRSPVNVYYFSYRGAYSYSDTVTGAKGGIGPSHGDDLAYVLDSFFDPTSTDEDLKMQEVLIDLWVSYACDGTADIGVEWPRLNQSSIDEDFSYLHIAGPEKIYMESSSDLGEIKFWRTIPFRENIPSTQNSSGNA